MVNKDNKVFKEHDLVASTHSGRTQKQHLQQDFNNFQRIISESKQHLLQLYISACGLKGKIFSICYSTGEFLLHFLKVIITMNVLTSLTDC